MTALELIIQERERQQLEEGYSPAHDDQLVEGELALLAAAYALSSRGVNMCYEAQHGVRECVREYEWEFKPKEGIEDLVRAGALILAELETVIRELGI